MIITSESDDTVFLSKIELFCKEQISILNPRFVFATKIDNWFDDKWLNFSGKPMHELAIWKMQDVTFPPFHPNRVIKTDCFKQDGSSGMYSIYKEDYSLHKLQSSAENLKFKV